MDYIIKTGTDSEGNAVTTTLNVQMNFVWEYSNHETQNFVNNQEMPRIRENDMVKMVRLKITGTDTTSGNASHLVDGQADQTHEEYEKVYFMCDNETKIKPSKLERLVNNGFDDEEGYYRIQKGDHIAYRY